MTSPISRRDFLAGAGALVALGGLSGCTGAEGGEDASRLLSRPGTPTERAESGMHPLALGSDRDGFLYVPASYSPVKPAPLAVLLHGAGQSSRKWSSAPLDMLFGGRGIVVLGPDSRSTSWDIRNGGFGVDVQFIDAALALVFRRCAIDPTRIVLGGFSDGASYALSLGASNGDLFTALMAFSPGFFRPGPLHGKPRIFISHGTSDSILPIDETSRLLVPQLRKRGYDVTYVEFPGDHTVPEGIARSAVDWFMA
jgi:phospholipase/carboxylesterase